MNINAVIGLVFLVLGVGLMLIFFFVRRNQPVRALRSISAFQHLRRALGLAVEDGKRLHVSLGQANILNSNGASALVGLSTLERVAQLSSLGDRPPVATSGDGTLAILSQDTLRSTYRRIGAFEMYNPDRGRLAGPTPFAYIAGTLPVISREQVSANLLIGNFGPEGALLCERAEQQSAFTLAASDALPAQAALYASAQEPLIGEELFAVPAYLQGTPVYQVSLHVQDILRWVVVGVLVIGAIFQFIMPLLGGGAP